MQIAPPYAPIFSRFQDLPCELRLKIWSLMFPLSRNVHINYNMKSATSEQQRVSQSTGWTSATPVPIVFHINHESRAEANKMLAIKPQFGSRSHDPRIYFDFERDTLVFGDGTGEHPKKYLLDTFIGGGYHGANDYEKVQRMSLDISQDNYDKRSFIWKEIGQFKGLKELTLYAWDSDCDKNPLTHYLQYGFSMATKSSRNAPKVTVKTPDGSVQRLAKGVRYEMDFWE